MRPDGTPASSNNSTRASPLNGVRSEGLSTTPLPAIRAGPSLCATRFSGSLNGVIAATIPTGFRLYQPILLPAAVLSSKSRVDPDSSLDAAAERRRVSMQRLTSRSASVMVLLLSAAMMLAKRADCSSEQPSRLLERLPAGAQRPRVELKVTVDVRDSAANVLGRRGAHLPEQEAVFRIAYVHRHVRGLPLAFEEGPSGKIGDLRPADVWLRTRVNDACG